MRYTSQKTADAQWKGKREKMQETDKKQYSGGQVARPPEAKSLTLLEA